MCHLWGEQRCSPLFLSLQKSGRTATHPSAPVFSCGRGRGPFGGQKLRLPSPPPRQKTFFRACPVSGDRPVASGKTSGCLQKRSVSSIWLRRIPDGPEGLRDVIGDVCLMPVPGPSPKSSAISFRVVTLTKLTPKIKKAAGTLPQPWYLVMASGHLRLIHARNGRQNARYRLRPGNHRSGLPRSPAAVPKRCSADAWSFGGCRPTGPHAGASLRPPRAPDLPRR